MYKNLTALLLCAVPELLASWLLVSLSKIGGVADHILGIVVAPLDGPPDEGDIYLEHEHATGTSVTTSEETAVCLNAPTTTPRKVTAEASEVASAGRDRSSTGTASESLELSPVIDPEVQAGDDHSDSDDHSESFEETWERALINLDALRVAVANLLPGEECIKAEPFACGTYNAVARLTLLSGRVILGRVVCKWKCDDYHPFPAFKERSEIATIQYLHTHTNIPVAEIYAYSDDEDNAVGGKLTLQEMLPGECLALAWDELSDAARKCIFQQIADIRLQLFHLNFDTIGSLTGTRDEQSSFTVGPIVEMKVNRDDLVGPPPEPGPWSISREWLATLARGGLRYEIDSPPASYRYSNRDWVARMTELARRLDNGVPYDGDLALCGMRHYDFDLQNILVEASPDGSSAKITGIIDWDGAQIIPRWALAAAFRFVTWHSPKDEPDLARLL